MTPEMAAYYRAMLMVGLGDGFYEAFDKALEEEDPLSDLTRSLCSCISNEAEVIHILTEYTLDHILDEAAVRDLIVADIRKRYNSEEMTRIEVVRTLYAIVLALDKYWQELWDWCTIMNYALEVYEEGLASEEAFHECFDAWWSCGSCIDIWELQRQKNQQKLRKQHQNRGINRIWNKLTRLFRR